MKRVLFWVGVVIAVLLAYWLIGALFSVAVAILRVVLAVVVVGVIALFVWPKVSGGGSSRGRA